VRWQHPEHGLLSPAEFIPLAERTGLIHPLTHYVLDAALRQCRRWDNAGHEISVAVNVSARRLLGCDAIQGYYISKPMPVDDLNQWLDQVRGRASATATRQAPPA